MTDRELLEMAAKAAGMNVPEWKSMHGQSYWVPAHGLWNPLKSTDDVGLVNLIVQAEKELELRGRYDQT